jgi:dTDP-glucose 4,6-dehydratase
LAAHKKVESFLFVSSGAVYGTQPPDLERISEDYAGGPNIADPGSAYGEAKRYAEILCTLYHQNSGVAVRIARPFTFVGPYQDLNAGFAVTDFIRDALQGLPLHIQGDGTAIRSYYYASDLAAALWRVLLDGLVGRAYNVGSDEPISILELARKIILILGTPTEIIVNGEPVPDKRPHRYVPDISRGVSELGLPAGIGLEEALRRTLDWMRDTQQASRARGH